MHCKLILIVKLVKIFPSPLFHPEGENGRLFQVDEESRLIENDSGLSIFSSAAHHEVLKVVIKLG